MRSFRTLTNLSILSILVAVNGGAAQTRSRYELGTFGGYTFFDSVEPLDDAVGGGAVFGFYMLRRLSLEAEASFATTGDTAGSRSVYLPIRARVLYSQPVSGTSQLLAGTGVVRTSYLRDVDDVEYGASGLVGLQVFVGRSIDLRIDGVADYIPQSTFADVGESWHFALRAGVAVRLGPAFVERRAPADADREGAGPDAGRDGVLDAEDECAKTSSGATVDRRGCEPGPDVDGDGVRDADDACPGTRSGVAVDNRGCPLTDGDEDGVPDGKDRCPLSLRGARVDDRGCAVQIVDADGDGVADGDDECPGTLGGVLVSARGCPLWADTDGDGVYDRQDVCPRTPPGRAVDERGCPVALDTDNDGVRDGVDRCPGTAAAVDVDARGCPLPGDADADGVADSSDACPGTPGGMAVDARGCPASPDADEDGDGVRNAKDKCPGSPAGERVDAAGCRMLFDGGSTSETLRGVEFVSYDRYELTSQARQVLDGVARWLSAHPGVRIEIASHTDNREYRQYALIRSLGRASAVRRYLVSLGVDGSQLTAKGYGPDQPIANNDTAAGRAMNERIELRRSN